MVCKKMECQNNVFTWDVKNTPDVLGDALKALSKRYPGLQGGKSARKLTFKQGENISACSVKANKNGYEIEYGTVAMALRMVGNLLSGIVPEKAEYCPFRMFGIMLDCSRNAVMTVEHLKTYLDRLAILGYNMVMLYTEDTYEIKDEPFFGIMRGAYTQKEIKEIDAYAAKLGMEVIPCIQTLGHLEQIFKWGAFGEVADTSGIMLADEPKTYELIEKMLVTWKNAVRSKRIHVGMDEAHNLGRGRFYDLHGDENHFNIFNRHLKKVTELCKKHGLEPMIWSDMYFRMGSKNNDYYDKNCVIPPKVVKEIPKEAELVYWDYYHTDKEFYLDWIERHRKLGHEPLMGSGVWTWNKYWYDYATTVGTVKPCVEACREAKVNEVFFTMWGDNGGFCDFDSAFAGLAYASELSFTGDTCVKALNAKFDALFDHADYDAVVTASNLENSGPNGILWDDPIMMMHLGGAKFRNDFIQPAIENSAAVSKKLSKAKKSLGAGELKHAKLLADAMHAKLLLADTVIDAYIAKKDNKKAMKAVFPLIADYRKKFEAFVKSFRAMWLRNNKPFGLETMQIRFAGQLARLEELELRLKDFCGGKVDIVPEFDELLKLKGKMYSNRPSNASSII